MAYLGKGLGSLTTANITVDKMTGNGSTATLTITLAQGVNSVNDISVFVSGVMQRPGTDYTLSGSILTFTTAPANGLQVVAVSHGDSVLDCVADATAITASFDNNSVPDSAIGSLAASKLTGALAGAATNLTSLNAAQLTGALPAVAATNLTNLTSANLTGALPAMSAANLTGVSSYTKNASDPAANTNPTAVGAVWVNSTSGETYVCTDATTDANVWTNVGGGDGDIVPWAFKDGGVISCYLLGGQFSSNTSNKIEKISVTADGNSTDVANLLAANHGWGGCSSQTHGYSGGGSTGGWGTGPFNNVIQKFQFSTDSDATDVADMTVTVMNRSGQSMSTHGYQSGGQSGAAATSINVIDRFPLASDANSQDVGDLDAIRSIMASASDTDYGYCSGGESTPAPTNVIQRFQFVASANSSDVGDLVNSVATPAGHTYSTHGFVSGGGTNVIQSFAFASSGNATDLANLTWSATHAVGSESTSYGYGIGGYPLSNIINKFAFASTTNATDVGDLTESKGAGATAHN